MIELLCLVGIVLLLVISQTAINAVYGKYANKDSGLEYTGKDVAERMLSLNGVNSVHFGTTKGELTDYYNPKSRTIYFSKKSHIGNSVASIAVAAHETGHAIQDQEGYFMLKVRKMLAPVCSISSKFVWVAIFLGVILGMLDFILIGLVLMGVTILFQLITLPVEFDASRRAVAYLSTVGYSEETMDGVRAILKAAAFTYVASAMASILQLIRLVAAFKDD